MQKAELKIKKFDKYKQQENKQVKEKKSSVVAVVDEYVLPATTSKAWGTGTGASTMSIHIKKPYYLGLGWKINDTLVVKPDFKNKTITLKKLDLDSA